MYWTTVAPVHSDVPFSIDAENQTIDLMVVRVDAPHLLPSNVTDQIMVDVAAATCDSAFPDDCTCADCLACDHDVASLLGINPSFVGNTRKLIARCVWRAVEKCEGHERRASIVLCVVDWHDLLFEQDSPETGWGGCVAKHDFTAAC